MPYFLSPRKILFGKGMLKRLGLEIEGRESKAFVITDKNMAKIIQPLVDAVKAAGFEVKIWDEAEPEPSTTVAEKAFKALQEVNPQLIIAFGGGSVIDTAKAAWVFWENPQIANTDISVSVNPKTKLSTQRKSRFLVVPTTSGTGSDVTWAIVLSNVSEHRKIGFANSEIVPDFVLLAPEFTVGMPPSLTASTGMDVLGHALDGLTARQQNDFSDGLCLQAVKMTFDWLPKACKDGSDLVAREKMQNAATIAGLGFGNSNTSLSHSLGHSLGAVFHIPHGRAVGLAVPYSLDYVTTNPPLENTPDPNDKLSLAARFIGIAAEDNRKSAALLIQKIRELQKSVGEPLSLKEAGITEEQMKQNLDVLVTNCSKDVNMYSCPCECKGEALKSLFMKMWAGV